MSASWSSALHEKDVGTQDAPYDAYHINSVATTNHGYLVSLRHMWSGFRTSPLSVSL
jgi:hypothetical protein